MANIQEGEKIMGNGKEKEKEAKAESPPRKYLSPKNPKKSSLLP